MRSLNSDEYQEYLELKNKMENAAECESNEAITRKEFIRLLQLVGVIKNPRKDIRNFRRYLSAKREKEKKDGC